MTTSNHSDDDQEMSMDEILASIRRYVSSDEPVQKADSKPVEPLVGRPQSDMEEEHYNQRITPHLDIPRQDMSHQEEVVRLNESVVEERPQSPLWGDEPFKPATAVNREEPRFSRPSPSSSSVAPKQSNVAPKPTNDGLVSDKTLATTMESFARLRDASTQKVAPKHEPVTTPGLNPTLDQLFESLARPMIRDWLDRNLPSMVERMVMREIERITKS